MKNKKTYKIKEGYVSRDSYHHFDHSYTKDEYQDEVYETAYKICVENGFTKVLDIGAGSGYKFIKYFKDFDAIGLEIEPTLSWLQTQYPEYTWQESDFNNHDYQCDVVLCSDVIEHLVDPDELIEFLKKIDFKYAIISTPEREAIQMYQRHHLWDGPPDNLAHVREWTFKEFENYISESFDIKKQFMSKNHAESSPLCQIVICMKKRGHIEG